MLKKKTDRRWKISLWCSTWKALGLARTQLRSSRLLLFPWETLRVKASTGCCVCFNIINTPSSCLLPCFHDQNALTYLDTTGSFCQQCQSTGEPPWCMGWRWGKSNSLTVKFKGYDIVVQLGQRWPLGAAWRGFGCRWRCSRSPSGLFQVEPNYFLHNKKSNPKNSN